MKSVWLAVAVLVAFWSSRAAQAEAAGLDPLKVAPTIEAPAYSQVRREVQAWIDEHSLSPTAHVSIEALWPDRPTAAQPSADLLDRLATSAALADSRAAALVAVCSQPRTGVKLPEVAWLTTAEVPPLVSNNLRLLYGRWLSHERLYDESLEQLKGLDPADVVDPAALLFYQAAAHHRLLHKTEGLAALDRLLNDVVIVPQRYKAVATLMRGDLESLDDETLDHIARRMDDVRRRLDLGRAGKRVREVEDSVIESLDKLIEEMEKQQQQQQSGGGSGPGGSSMPMQQPRLAPAFGSGEVDHKRIGNTSGWGDLPPKQREEALQQIGKDFPAHYRDVIEQYFRKLASEAGQR